MPVLTDMHRPLLLFLGLLVSVHPEDDCISSSCHPPLGDLMVGRSGQLSASSTCGLNGPQNYCIIGYLEDEKKCFTCDSRYPYKQFNNRSSHQIENVITTFEPERKMKWWQSENGVHHVSIQLNLETLFQFSHLILTFKSFRPSAMLVERSKDNGKTWKVLRYFARDCVSSFPGIPTETAKKVDDVICESRYSGAEPSTGGEVVLKALDPNFQISDPHAPHIQELITMTNLRVNFTRLLTLGDTLLSRRRRNPQDKYYYALYEMVVRGSCFCNGHARECMPVHGTRGDVFLEPGMVHGRCVCQHNTAGDHCERCQDFHNDAPWRPAGQFGPHACRKCNCNGHSERCHFDMQLYLTTGGLSGGVCDNCRNNRAGVHCQLCRPFYYWDPRLPQDHPDACIPCDCEHDGSVDSGTCDPSTGRCICKVQVEGDRCDRCKYGFYGLSRGDPQGCQVCMCNQLGSVVTPYLCHPSTGHCLCQHFATGPLCDQCMPGHWGLGNTVHGCSACECDVGGAIHAMCSPVDGQCQCRPNMVGRRCKDPAPGYFLTPLDFYLYEAESAVPQNPSALNESTTLPTCEKYFKDQGYDFTFKDGRFILRKKAKQETGQKEWQQTTIPVDPGLTLQVIARERTVGQPVTWTGQGFVRVKDGAELRFIVDDLPVSLDYLLVIRYEPESSEDWTANVRVTASRLPSTGYCPHHQMTARVTLPGSHRVAILNPAVCLSDGGLYHVDITFQKITTQDDQSSSHILVDSMGLIPKIESLQDFCSQTECDEFQRYQCVEISSEVGAQVLPEVCEDLIGSISARINNGAVACRCNPVGSFSQSCSKFGGQCDCKPNVIGRCCDSCAPHAFGLGPGGCSPCDCDPQGSFLGVCDQVSGQCPCRRDVLGRRCDRCRPGYFGFPHCQACQCNGLADSCDPDTGACLDCRGNTTGPACDRCMHGYYSNPAFGELCQPCLCPDTVASGRFFARLCNKDPNSLHMQCDCHPGHSGPRCDICFPGYYGNLAIPGARCVECHCNNNVDPQDHSACDAVTGECLRCLYSTYGSHCERCQPGYYGNALTRDCKACSCDLRGTELSMCPVRGPCFCHQTSGQCPCRTGVRGPRCDACDDGFWNLGGAAGCQPCDCDPSNSMTGQCDEITGQCNCRPGFGGLRCNECADNFFGNPELHCTPCDCNMAGVERPACDRHTGECICRPGITGTFCHECAVGHEATFPACPPCHLCWSPWAQKVTDLLLEVERLARIAPDRDDRVLPDYGVLMDTLQTKLVELMSLIGDCTADTEKMEMLCQHISMLKDVTNPNIIIIDKSPLLNTEIDNIRHELNRQLEILTEKLKQNKNIDRKGLEEALREIRKHHASIKHMEQQCKGAKVLLETSKRKRQVAKELLDGCPTKDLDSLERKVKNLNVDSFNEVICGEPGHADCSEAPCGGALCRDALGARRCGGLGCTGVLPASRNATAVAEQVKRVIADLLGHLKHSETKINDTKLRSRDIKAKTEKLKRKINKKKEELETSRNETMDLIQRVKSYLRDEMVNPEDIETVANAVLAIQLPLSPEEIQDVINTIKALLVNKTKLIEDLDHLLNQTRIAQELLERAKDVVNKTQQIDSVAIKQILEGAERMQQKANEYLESAIENMETGQRKTQEIERKLDNVERNLPSMRMSDILRQIEALRRKTEMNRAQAKEVKAAADASLDNTTDAKMLLDDVMRFFEELKKKGNESNANDVISERLKNVTKEAEKIGGDIKDKTIQAEELEKWILDLEARKQKKAGELMELMNEVAGIRDEITKRAAAYSSCT